MTDSKYKCDNMHEILNPECRSCIDYLIDKYSKLFDFVKSIADSNDDVFFRLSMRAEDLLKEIGED